MSRHEESEFADRLLAACHRRDNVISETLSLPSDREFNEVVGYCGNWRVIRVDDAQWAQILIAKVMWIWPDCSLVCEHCGECLGCLRKMVIVGNFANGQPILNEYWIKCDKSPTGFHVAKSCEPHQ